MGIRVVAVDWSGDRRGGHRKIWLAEAVDGTLLRLENGRNRDAIADHLIGIATADPNMVIGLDFAFSMPAWFLEQRRLASAAELWALADCEADDWLAACAWPFWGRPGVPCPKDLPDPLRQTDRDVPKTGGIRPKSVFQVGGAGAVGTGSLRGMRTLHRLHAAGFSIWPFDPPGWPRVVEIYPRLLTGPVNKSSFTQRAEYLDSRYPDVVGDPRLRAAASEDAFDAAVSALVMARATDDLANLPPPSDRRAALEGLIWYPRAHARSGDT